MKRFALLALLGFPLVIPQLVQSVLGQQATSQTPASDPQALALASQAIAALTGGASIQDVTLAGTETHIAGSLTETSPVTLKAMGTDSARIDRQVSNTSEVRTNSSGMPVGSWTGADGSVHSIAQQNCWTDPSWFFPIFLSAFGSAPGMQLTYVGQESLNGTAVQHIRSSKLINGQSGGPVAFVMQLSQTDIFLDAQSFLPLAIRFNIYPDNSTNMQIPVEISYSNYQIINGIRVPLHIQKYVQGDLNVDLAISSAILNSGLTPSSFQVQ